MTDPQFRRRAVELRRSLGAETVALVVVGRDGVMHTGADGERGEELAAALLDRALDVMARPAPPVVIDLRLKDTTRTK